MDPENLARKYVGATARHYEGQRAAGRQWKSEDRIVRKFLQEFPEGTRVLDVPVGTGRFLALYEEAGLAAVGIDISDAMLLIAKEKRHRFRLEKGDIFNLRLADGEFDVTVCMRFMNWLGPEDFERALGEIARVTRDAILIYIPTCTRLMDIRPWTLTGLARLARQWRLRFYRLRHKSREVIHETAAVARVFDQLGLEVERRSCFNQHTRAWTRGYERNIYLLRKL